MPRVQDIDEVRILRFFEEEPLQRAETLFRIVAAKMKKRILPETAPKKKDPHPPRQPGGAKTEEESRVS